MAGGTTGSFMNLLQLELMRSRDLHGRILLSTEPLKNLIQKWESIMKNFTKQEIEQKVWEIWRQTEAEVRDWAVSVANLSDGG